MSSRSSTASVVQLQFHEHKPSKWAFCTPHTFTPARKCSRAADARRTRAHPLTMEPVRVHPGLLGLLATYLRILFSMFSKPRWRGGDTAPTLPTLQATFTQPTRVRPGVLQQFRMAAGWAKEVSGLRNPNLADAKLGHKPGVGTT